jgi:hypothetical protein
VWRIICAALRESIEGVAEQAGFVYVVFALCIGQILSISRVSEVLMLQALHVNERPDRILASPVAGCGFLPDFGSFA